MTAREAVAGARRLVVKIGSTSLTSVDGGLDVGRLDALVDAVAARAAGTQVVLVSSGAIAAGLRPLGLPRRPRDLATQQAAAGVGQLHLTRAYAEAFARHGRTVGQVLLTSHDVVRRQPYRNAQRTFERLLGLGVVPVVNENDTVATDEIRFGDNDRLAALVAHVISADALVLLSDVAGVYDADPRDPGATLVREVTGGADLAGVRVGKTSSLGTGGMASKLAAADLASGAGVPVLVAAAADAPAALDGAEVGTVFAPHGPRLSARRFWLRHMAGTRGRLHLDAGAVKAVVGRRRSLLAAGIVGSDGDFEAGDVVDLVDPRGDVVARGVVAFDAEELPEISGRSSEDLAPEHRREVVHADDLVPVGSTLPGTDPAPTGSAPTDAAAYRSPRGRARGSVAPPSTCRQPGLPSPPPPIPRPPAPRADAFPEAGAAPCQKGGGSSAACTAGGVAGVWVVVPKPVLRRNRCRQPGSSSLQPSSGRGRGRADGRGRGSGSRILLGRVVWWTPARVRISKRPGVGCRTRHPPWCLARWWWRSQTPRFQGEVGPPRAWSTVWSRSAL